MEWHVKRIEIRAQQEANKGLSQEEKQALRKAKKAEKAARVQAAKEKKEGESSQSGSCFCCGYNG